MAKRVECHFCSIIGSGPAISTHLLNFRAYSFCLLQIDIDILLGHAFSVFYCIILNIDDNDNVLPICSYSSSQPQKAFREKHFLLCNTVEKIRDAHPALVSRRLFEQANQRCRNHPASIEQHGRNPRIKCLLLKEVTHQLLTYKELQEEKHPSPKSVRARSSYLELVFFGNAVLREQNGCEIAFECSSRTHVFFINPLHRSVFLEESLCIFWICTLTRRA